ncbi:hypothetical protein NMG60_11022137 [Bertholletia excelsa]
MKGVKVKLLKKLKSIKPIGYLKPERILHVNASDGLLPNFLPNAPQKSVAQLQAPVMAFTEEQPRKLNQDSITVQEPEVIDVSELMRDIEDDEMDFEDENDDTNDKENVGPEKEAKDPIVPESRNGNSKHIPLSEIDVTNFRRPEWNSSSLFDPNLLEAFEHAIMEVKAHEAERRSRIEQLNLAKSEEEEEPPLKSRKIEEENRDPLFDFEEKCPPGGSDSVILYTTGLRGIRKTFEDCNSIRFLLESFKVVFYERDISMHSEFREELWRTLGGKIVPPRLFIKGRYIGGAEVVLALHEQGKLRRLFSGIPINRLEGRCDGCSGIRFIMCFKCNGSQKLLSDDGESLEKCPECNENGLIICPICC